MAEYSIFMQYDPQDNIYVASVPELPGCMAHGETKEEALKEIELARELWIETALEDGETIPEPHLFNAMSV
ncbi:MAG TPA: type II toxin-antitoxin system HicB family antitoxin [Lachnospiraceae bacterium]|nr:type II toxin-antitoxin system HicB family antitoxin [Lachnospiraceae bacterium]